MSPLLSLHRVREPGRHTAGWLLDGVEWVVEAGCRLAVLGAEGAGKGHLLRIMAGLVEPAAGEVLWEGEPLATCSAQRRAALVGVLFADVERQFLAPLVGEEIALGPGAQGLEGAPLRARVSEAMVLAGVPDPWRELPLARLTPSQRTRVAMAALLATRPRLLLAEEPGALLSLEGEEELAALLARLAREQGVASVIFTNRRERAHRFADTVLLLADGRLNPLSGS